MDSVYERTENAPNMPAWTVFAIYSVVERLDVEDSIFVRFDSIVMQQLSQATRQKQADILTRYFFREVEMV
jgi:hypothetical protein